MTKPRERPSTNPAPRSDAPLRGERVYDSFVVRLWREAGSRRLLQVEVEHGQSGGRVIANGVPFGWIARQIQRLVAEVRAPAGPPV